MTNRPNQNFSNFISFGRQALILAALSVCFGVSHVTALAGELDEVRDIYTQMHTKVSTEYTTAVASAGERYGASLDAVVTHAQSRGDLEALLSVMAEKKRFGAEKTIPRDTPSGASPSLQKIRQNYFSAITNAKKRRDATLPMLQSSYLKKLEEMKKQLTREGKLEAALAIRSEIDSVGQGRSKAPAVRKETPPPVVDNRFEARPQVSPKPATVNKDESNESSSVSARQAFLDRHRKKSEDRKRSSSARPTESLSEGMGQYREAMQGFAAKFESDESEIVRLKEVQSSPDTYVGRVLRSGVYVQTAFARGVRVSSGASGANSIELMPNSMSIGKAAQELFKAVGPGGKVVITYGVVNKDLYTLLDMKSL
jgi:hypothetical protein